MEGKLQDQLPFNELDDLFAADSACLAVSADRLEQLQ